MLDTNYLVIYCENSDAFLSCWVPHGLCCQELERKKQAEFEAQAKEMELKAAEEKATVASNPALLEVKERLDKLELTIKEIVVESKKQLNDATKDGKEDSNVQKKAAEVEPDNTQNQPGSKI